jgi:uncharacterized membrane protein
MNSEILSNKPEAKSSWLLLFFPILGAIGFVDATYLTVKHFLGTPVACSLLHGCETVLTSKYASVFGIPTALLGSFYYLTILILAVLYLDSRKQMFLKLLAYLTPIGFIASLCFVYLQIFVIKAICLYCMTSAATSTLLFIIGMTYLAKQKNKSELSS